MSALFWHKFHLHTTLLSQDMIKNIPASPDFSERNLSGTTDFTISSDPDIRFETHLVFAHTYSIVLMVLCWYLHRCILPVLQTPFSLNTIINVYW